MSKSIITSKKPNIKELKEGNSIIIKDISGLYDNTTGSIYYTKKFPDLINNLNTPKGNILFNKLKLSNKSLQLKTQRQERSFSVMSTEKRLCQLKVSSKIEYVDFKKDSFFFSINGNKPIRRQNLNGPIGKTLNYCPFCEHCTKIKSTSYLDESINILKDSKNVVSSLFNHILDSFLLKNKKNHKENQEKDNKSLFDIDDNSIESIVKSNPKSNLFSSFGEKILFSFFDSLLEEKFEVESILNRNTISKLNESYLSHGEILKIIKNSSRLINPNELSESNIRIVFDKEVVDLIDKHSRKEFIRLINQMRDFNKSNKARKSKEEMSNSESNSESNSNSFLKERNENKDRLVLDYEKEGEIVEKSRRRILVIYSIIMQIISDYSILNKDKSVLLFKAIKNYFLEQEKKFNRTSQVLLNKINYYKELLVFIMNNNIDKDNEQNDHDLNYVTNSSNKQNNVISINEIEKIFSTNLTQTEKLNMMMTIFKRLTIQINQQRERIYILKSENEIKDKLLNIWIYGWDKLKLVSNIKTKLSSINIKDLNLKLSNEINHKRISDEDKLLILNSQRFIMVSSQSNYFLDQQIYQRAEIEKLTRLYNDSNIIIEKEKKENQSEVFRLNSKITQLEGNISLLKEKYNKILVSNSSQTDVDLKIYNKIYHDHEIVMNISSINKNVLNDCIERIKYNITSANAISKKALLYLIPEIYNERVLYNIRQELNGNQKSTFNSFFYSYMKGMFKLDSLIKNNIESVVLGILKYSAEDSRISFFGKCLGIDSVLRTEILDSYLIFLRNLPFSFFKLYSDEYDKTYISGEYAFEVFYNSFYQFKFHDSLVFDVLHHMKIGIIRLNHVVIDDDNDSNDTVDLVGFSYDLVNAKSKSNDLSIDFDQEGKTSSSSYSRIYIKKFLYNSTEIIDISSEKVKFELLILHKMYIKSYIFIGELRNKLKNGEKEVKIDVILLQFSLINKEISIEKTEILSLIKKYFVFNHRTNSILIESLLLFYSQNQFSFKISLVKYINLTIESLILLFSQLEDNIKKVLNSNSSLFNKDFLTFSDFEDSCVEIISNLDKNRFKINRFYSQILNGAERKSISKEEFIQFCLNEFDPLSSLIGKTKIGVMSQIVKRQSRFECVINKFLKKNFSFMEKRMKAVLILVYKEKFIV